MKAIAPNKQVTYDEFFDLVKDGQKADLIDGMIHMASPDNTDANEIQGWLSGILGIYCRQKNLGKVYTSRVACRLSETQAPEPDLVFVRTERQHIIERGCINGAPDMVMEIVSPDSIDRDYKMKRRQYQQAGIPEYWIIDEIEKRVTLLRSEGGPRYREVRPRKGILRSAPVEGFWLRPEWLWQQPLPNCLSILDELLPER